MALADQILKKLQLLATKMQYDRLLAGVLFVKTGY